MATVTTMPDPVKARQFFENKMMFTTGPVEVSRKIHEKTEVQIVDVRAGEDYAKGHVPGAVNLPRNKWNTLEGLSKDKLNILYCYSQTCHLAAAAAVEFARKGYSVMEMEGGFESWQEHDLEVESSSGARAA